LSDIHLQLILLLTQGYALRYNGSMKEPMGCWITYYDHDDQARRTEVRTVVAIHMTEGAARVAWHDRSGLIKWRHTIEYWEEGATEGKEFEPWKENNA